MHDPQPRWHEPVFDAESTTGRLFVPALMQVRAAVAAARDVNALRQCATGIQSLVHRLVDQAQAAEPMTQLISMLNDVLTRRVIEVASAGNMPEGVRWCWIALGSEGRQEQTLSSDQDNGIIFEADMPPERLRATLLPLAQRINGMLAECGFALCTGGVMAGNPQWCLSLHEWKECFSDWIMEGDPQSLLNASIFFDLRPLFGNFELAGALGRWLAREASANSRFLFQMAANSQRRDAPIGLFGRFIVENEGMYAGCIDLKVNAATIFVDAARIYGLACGIHASNTADRFRLAAEARRLHPQDADRWIRAFHFIQTLRLKNQQRSYKLGKAMHNHVDPARLDAADRKKLVEALRAARALQHRLALDYPGSEGV